MRPTGRASRPSKRHWKRSARRRGESRRVATEGLARANELFAIQTKLRNQASARPLGWTTTNLRDVPRAVTLAHGDPEVLRDLRSAAAIALLSDDLHPLDPIAQIMTGSELATDPNSGLVAVGEYKGWGKCQVALVEPATGRIVHRLSYKAIPVKGNGSSGPAQDGTRAGVRPGRQAAVRRHPEFARAPVRPERTAEGSARSGSGSGRDRSARVRCRRKDAVRGVFRTARGRAVSRHAQAAQAAQAARRRAGAFDRGAPVRRADRHDRHAVTPVGRRRHAPVRTRARRDSVAVGPGSLLLVGAGQRLEVYDQHTLQPTDAFADPSLRRTAHEENVQTIAVHPSGAFVATGPDSSERRVRVWELASGRLIAAVTVAGIGPISPTWSADGAYLLVTVNAEVARWRFAPAAVERFVCASGTPLAGAMFAPDGRIAAVGESLGGWCEVLVASGVTPEQAERAHDPHGVEHPGLAVAPDGTIFIATGLGGAVWKPGSPPRAADLAKHRIGSPRLSPDGNTLWAVVDSHTVLQPSTRSRAAQRGVWDNSFSETLYGVSTLNALAAGRTGVVAGGREGVVYWLDTQFKVTGFHEPDKKTAGPGDAVLSVAVAPDDSFVVAGTVSGKLRYIRPADKTELPAMLAHPGGVSAVAISRDGALLATGGRDQSVRLWMRAGNRFEPLLTVPALPGAVRRLYFSPTDGRLLVLLAHEHAVRVWDVDRLHAQLAELTIGW